ncbi:caspase family protein [Methylobacterium durans]|uniref:Peptidase C14 n=1 Tax=Methylobacterium durans TaxID=2202825 RepID=A0A2U8W4P1_9HYPH|nr:caspase domain-containing protein [Methylobacterium durans]AWN40480.1 peptidase C14 [Methylobacterium durans]
MREFLRTLIALAALLTLALASGPAGAQQPEKRIALVIGNAAYPAAPLATAANDAGLVAQTLQAAGFDVVGARDLDEDSLRRALREFVDKAAASGPSTVAFLYLAGYGLQLEGENYFTPVDARIGTAADVAVRALRISDYVRSLAALPLKARFVVLDASRKTPFVTSGDPLAGGLALSEADPGTLIAYNAAPSTVGLNGTEAYGAYARALTEMMREGGLQPGPLFERVRLRVDELTKGAEVPWHVSRIETGFMFFERASDAPVNVRPEQIAALRARPLRELSPSQAYAICLERDDLASYQEFVTAFPRDGMARRVRALIAARREAVTWRRTWLANTPDAYWSYLSRYPRGPHAWDARRRLTRLAASLEPPPRFAMLDYDLPPPPPDEVVYVERGALYLDDPIYELPAPPPPPVVFLPPPTYIVTLPPPPPPVEVYALPTPAFVPVPAYVNAPAYIAPPPNNILYQNIHVRPAAEQIHARNALRSPDQASPTAMGAGAVLGAAAGASIARVALPPSVAQKAALHASPSQIPTAASPVQPGISQAGSRTMSGHGQVGAPAPQQVGRAGGHEQSFRAQALPGMNGQPLPQQASQSGLPGRGPNDPMNLNRLPLGQQPPAANGLPLSHQSGRPADPRMQPSGQSSGIAQLRQEQLARQHEQQAAEHQRQAQVQQAHRAATQRQQDMQVARQQQLIQRQAQQAANQRREMEVGRQQHQAAQQRQQAMQAARQQQMAQQQSAQRAAQHQQMQIARQQMIQQQAAQRAAQHQAMQAARQPMHAPPSAPPPRGGPHHCPPGQACR